MTGLDLKNDALIEVAALVTDSELNILGDGVDVVIKPEDAAVEQMYDFVRDMHTRPGSWRAPPRQDHGRSRSKSWSTSRSGYRIQRRRRWAATRSAPTGCSSPATCPVVEHLHYRVIDVSTIKELSRRWFPRAYFQSPAKKGGHRALGDIKDSIEELRYYREAVFVLARARHRHGPEDRPAASPRGPDTPPSSDLRHVSGIFRKTAKSGQKPFPETVSYLRCVPSEPVNGKPRRRMVGVAELAERLVVVQEVAGSTPVAHPHETAAVCRSPTRPHRISGAAFVCPRRSRPFRTRGPEGQLI